MKFDQRLSMYVAAVEDSLGSFFPERPELLYAKVFRSMRYSVMAGGKRLRPVLLLEFNRICGGGMSDAMAFACALEAIHTYSLIHDDLPCMDNDDFRRGKPTNHRVFGEAVAVLAGDGLLSAAFEMMLAPQNKGALTADRILRAAYEIAVASGINGMVGGQIIDINPEETEMSIDRLATMDALKTGALISAACKAGCILAGADEELVFAAGEYASSLGLAFQIVDDMLDINGRFENTGKPVGSDQNKSKYTYPALIGIDECRKMVKTLTGSAVYALSPFHDTSFLSELAENLVNRDR